MGETGFRYVKIMLNGGGYAMFPLNGTYGSKGWRLCDKLHYLDSPSNIGMDPSTMLFFSERQPGDDKRFPTCKYLAVRIRENTTLYNLEDIEAIHTQRRYGSTRAQIKIITCKGTYNITEDTDLGIELLFI